MASTNKCLAQINKSRTGGKATKKRRIVDESAPWSGDRGRGKGGLLTLTDDFTKRHLGLTLRKVRSGDYRVNFRDGNETTAYYTNHLEDAVNTAVEMVRTREQSRC